VSSVITNEAVPLGARQEACHAMPCHVAFRLIGVTKRSV